MTDNDSPFDQAEPPHLMDDSAAFDPPAAANAVVPVEPTALADVNVEGKIKTTIMQLFAATEPVVTKLADRHRDVVHDLKTPAGLAAARAARHELRERARYPLKNAADAAKKALNSLKPIVEAEAERLIGITKPIEDQLHADIVAREKEIEDEKERERKAEAERQAKIAEDERNRVAQHRANILVLQGYVLLSQEKEPDVIEAAADKLATVEIGPAWQEFQAEAVATRDNTIMELRALATRKRQAAAAAAAQAQREAEAAERTRELEAIRAGQRLQAERMERLNEWAEYATRGPIESHDDYMLSRGLRIGIALVDVAEVFGRMQATARLAQGAALAQLDLRLSEWDARPAHAEAPAPAPIPEPQADEAPAPPPAPEPPPVTRSSWGRTTPPAPAPAPEPMQEPTTFLRIGAINDLLGPGLMMTRAFIQDVLGVAPELEAEMRGGTPSGLWKEHQFQTICSKLVVHVDQAARRFME